MKKEIVYDKLIRDKIPEIMKKSKQEFEIFIASKEEYRDKLLEKVKEELEEFKKTPCEEEMADLLEVLENLMEEFELKYEDVLKVKQEKMLKRGSFKNKLILKKIVTTQI